MRPQAKPGAAPWSPPLLLYRAAALSLGPALARWALKRRAARGKEDPARLQERFGVASRARPDRPVIWLHAASVGESLSLLPLLDALRTARPDLGLLVTTGTVTSAQIMERRLPDGAIHQFAPVDTAAAVRRFLSHWRPDLLCVVESELWPTMLHEAKRVGTPAALLSARVSEKSAGRWARAPRSIAALLDRFDLIATQDEAVRRRLLALGADPARLSVGGSLKQAAAPLPADPTALEALRARVAGRPIWLAASTHAGEETAALEAHRRLAERRPGMLTVIAPRHPERGEAAAEEVRAAGLSVTRRSLCEAPTAETDVHLVDVMGELGLWFRLCPTVFVGGSLEPCGGHNPLEPARLGTAVLIGPHTANMESECARLERADALLRVADAAALAEALAELLGADGEPSAQARRLGQAGLAATTEDDGVAARYLAALAPLLPSAAGEEGAKGDAAA